MKKKTVTITFHAPNNNGAFLQAFALQRALQQYLNVDNEILNFQSRKALEAEQLFGKIKRKNDVLRIIIAALHYKKLKKRIERFESMRHNHLFMTDFFGDDIAAKEKASKYQYAVFGSDQIWNPKILDFNDIYFGHGIECKKIAYAASCGPNSNDVDLKQYNSDLDEFYALATREKSSATKLRFQLNKDVSVTIDPTFLHDAEVYKELFAEQPMIDTPYIFLYTINYNSSVLEQSKRLSKLYGLPVVTVFSSYHAILCHKYGFKLLYDAGPSEFLNLLKNCKVVATNSFHGTALSVIFEKVFYFISEDVNGEMVRDDRIDDLLDSLGIECRISNRTSDDEILQKKSINYEEVGERVNELKKQSLMYLASAFED